MWAAPEWAHPEPFPTHFPARSHEMAVAGAGELLVGAERQKPLEAVEPLDYSPTGVALPAGKDWLEQRAALARESSASPEQHVVAARSEAVAAAVGRQVRQAALQSKGLRG